LSVTLILPCTSVTCAPASIQASASAEPILPLEWLDRYLTGSIAYKLKNKGCNAIILNDVSKHDLGFKSDENEVLILTPENSIKIEIEH
jgi:hypothetical protein